MIWSESNIISEDVIHIFSWRGCPHNEELGSSSSLTFVIKLYSKLVSFWMLSCHQFDLFFFFSFLFFLVIYTSISVQHCICFCSLIQSWYKAMHICDSLPSHHHQGIVISQILPIPSWRVLRSLSFLFVYWLKCPILYRHSVFSHLCYSGPLYT